MAMENPNQKQELTTVFVLLGALISLALVGPMSAEKIMEMWRQIFSQAHAIPTSLEETQGFLFFALNNVISILSPILIAIFFGGIVASLIRTRGLKISGDRLIPKFSRLNPVAGFKRIFSATSLMAFFKSIFIVTVISVVVFFAIKIKLNEILPMTGINASQIFTFMGEGALEILLIVLLSIALLAVIGKFASKKKPGMTRHEIAAGVSVADVVVINPEGVCVAIRYDKNKSAPYVVAKGRGLLARKIIAAAKSADVAIVEDISLASALFNSVEAGRVIPARLYQSVSEILTYVYRLKDKTTV